MRQSENNANEIIHTLSSVIDRAYCQMWKTSGYRVLMWKHLEKWQLGSHEVDMRTELALDCTPVGFGSSGAESLVCATSVFGQAAKVTWHTYMLKWFTKPALWKHITIPFINYSSSLQNLTQHSPYCRMPFWHVQNKKHKNLVHVRKGGLGLEL